MRLIQLSLQAAGIWLAVFSILCVAGCHSFNHELSSLFGEEAPPAAPAPVDPNAPRYYIEFRQEGRKPVMVTMPLSDVTYIQQALEQSGALKKFRRMKLELYRQLPQGGGHKLPIAFDRGERRVPSGSDYAIHPNDRIVVTEDTSNVVDDMMQSLSGAPKVGKK